VKVAGDRDAVEADDRNVGRDAEASGAEGGDGVEGEQVAPGEEGGDGGAGGEEAAGGGLAAIGLPFNGPLDQGGAGGGAGGQGREEATSTKEPRRRASAPIPATRSPTAKPEMSDATMPRVWVRLRERERTIRSARRRAGGSPPAPAPGSVQRRDRRH